MEAGGCRRQQQTRGDASLHWILVGKLWTGLWHTLHHTLTLQLVNANNHCGAR
jgi:hypothetical protein